MKRKKINFQREKNEKNNQKGMKVKEENKLSEKIERDVEIRMKPRTRNISCLKKTVYRKSFISIHSSL